MAAKNGGKRVLGKVPSRLCRHPVGQNFIEIDLSRTVYEMNALLHFMQKFKMAAKNGRKTIFGKTRQQTCRYPAGQKFQQNRSISHRYRNKCVFAFYAEIQDGRQIWWEIYFWGNSRIDSVDTLGSKIWLKSFYLALSPR